MKPLLKHKKLRDSHLVTKASLVYVGGSSVRHEPQKRFRNSIYQARFLRVSFWVKSALYLSFLALLAIAFSLLSLYVHINDFTKKLEITTNPALLANNITNISKIIVGAIGLSLGSYIIQQITKNQLASTSIMGISTSNVLVVTLIIISSVQFTALYSYLRWFIFLVTSVLAALILFFIAFKKNQNTSLKFILSGIILNFIFVAIGNNFLTNDNHGGTGFVLGLYLTGQFPLSNTTVFDLYGSLGVEIAAIVWFLFIAKRFFIANTNFLTARAVGVNATSVHLQGLLITGMLTSGAFILLGNITFLGIATGNIAYLLFKRRPILGYSGSLLTGIAFTMFCYFIGNNLISSTFAPSHNLVPIFITPFFIFLALRKKK